MSNFAVLNDIIITPVDIYKIHIKRRDPIDGHCHKRITCSPNESVSI